MKAINWLAGFILAGAIGLGGAAAADEPRLADLVDVLKQEGVIDEDQYAQIRSRAEIRTDKKAWFERISVWGDMRMRMEHFARSSDDVESDPNDRTRARYRFRLNMKADVNPYIDAYVRLASGENDSRSTNTTFGRPNEDFTPDPIFIDRAYLDIQPFPEGEILGHTADLHLLIGKMPNPFTTKKIPKDFMLWDGDINPEGLAIRSNWELSEAVDLYLNNGIFILEERSGGRDPRLMATQLGTNVEFSDTMSGGARTSFYHFDELNHDFFDRGVSAKKPHPSDGGGNAAFDGEYGLSDDNHVNVIEASAWLTCGCIEDCPITLFGGYSNNLSAVSLLGDGANDTAWMVGLQAGDKRAIAKLGVLYAHIEGNAFPSQFIDSDLFDGVTNRKGWAFYSSKSILKNTDINLTVFWSDPIQESPLSEFLWASSVANSERVRVQADLVVKF